MRKSRRVPDAIVIGGGISGLASAYYLSKKGLSSTLIEAQPRLGGLIRTDVIDSCQIEAGPDSYISTKEAATELIEEIPALRTEIIGTNDESRRIFLVHNGRLAPMPSGMVMMVPGNLRSILDSCLIPDTTRQSIVKERLFKPKERKDDVTVAEFVLDHFDSNMLEMFAEPLLTGVYGGDAGNLSARSVLPRFLDYERRYGSLVRAVRAESKTPPHRGSLFLSLRGGMQALTDALSRTSAGAVTRVSGEATRVHRESGKWQVHIGKSKQEGKNLFICLPAYRAASLFSDSLPALSGDLAAIPYSSAITVALGYERSQIDHPLDGFGFLVPRPERRRVAACTWINTKFPQRIAPNRVAMRAFLVDRDADDLMDSDDSDIVQIVRSEFQRLMGIESSPVFAAVQRAPQSMPQYVVGHGERLKHISALVKNESGLHLVGNAYEGVGIPDCIRLAKNAVAETEA